MWQRAHKRVRNSGFFRLPYSHRFQQRPGLPPKMNKKKIGLLLLLMALVALYVSLDLGRYLSLDYL